MVFRRLAATAAVLAFSTPGMAFEAGDQAASTMFYISIPLDFGVPRKDLQWSAGLQLQGRRNYPAVRIDSTMLNYGSLNDIDAKWIIAGLVAAGAAAALGSKDRSTSAHLAQQRAEQEASTPPCPAPVTDPCAR